MSQYDTKEAARLFTRKAAGGDPGAEATKSALELLETLCHVARSNGYQDSDLSGAEVHIRRPDTATDYVNVKTWYVQGVFRVETQKKGAAAIYTKVAGLHYDAELKQWCGDEPDPETTQEPGKPIRRRSAVAVIAEHVLGQLYPMGSEK